MIVRVYSGQVISIKTVFFAVFGTVLFFILAKLELT